MIVMKFGGTSVGDAPRISQVVRLVLERKAKRPVVVVSALSGVTNRLEQAVEAALARRDAELEEHLAWLRRRHLDVLPALEMPARFEEAATAAILAGMRQADELTRGISLLRECTSRTRDAMLAIGELMSHRIVSEALAARGASAVAIDPREVLRTDDRFGQAVPDREAIARLCAERLRPVIEAGDVPVTAGFVGATEDGLTTTLGRGGSDYSASLIGVALGASEVQIWTDVDGMMTADPRTVPAARTLPRVSFREASELAYFGAKVLHPATIRPAVEKNIPVRVLNTFRPDAPGTVIDETGDSASSAEPRVRAVAWKDGIATVSITSPRMLGAHGYLARVFEVFDRHATPVDVVTTSEVSVSMTVDRPERLGAIASDLSEFCQARIDLGMSLVCLVGEGLLESPQLVADVLAAVHPVTLRMLCLGSSDINLCLVVNEKDAKDVVRRLHARFLEGKP